MGTTNSYIHPTHKTLATMGNLAHLLPTGSVLMFRTLIPSFSNQGSCQTSNKYLVATLIALCSISCFLSTFTDSFTDDDGKQYYGLATFKGLHVFNRGRRQDGEARVRDGIGGRDLGDMKAGLKDFVHGFTSLIVFWAYAMSDSDVHKCLFSGEEKDSWDVLVVNLPIAAGIFSSFLFIILPTTRRGVGHAE